MVKKFGTRSEVLDGLALSTRGGLKADDLMINRSGKIVSKRKSDLAKKTYAQYGFKKRQAEPEPKPEEPQQSVAEIASKFEKKKRRRKRIKKNVAAETD